MILHRHVLLGATALTLMAEPAAAAPWVRGFVVGSYEYAFHYGGRPGFARAGEVEPGVDCPHGNTTYFANEASAKRILSALIRRAYRRPVTDADLHGPHDSIGRRARRTGSTRVSKWHSPLCSSVPTSCSAWRAAP